MDKIVIGAFAALMIVFTSSLVIFGVVNANHIVHDQKFCIESKDISVQNNYSRYLIFTTTNDVLEVTDSIVQGRWNSSNVYAYLKEGNCYKATLQGHRIPFLSMYRNILNPQLQ